MAVQRICVYAGSHAGDDPAYVAAAEALATELSRRRIGIVYGGGRVGLMGALAGAGLAAGAEVIGIIPHQLERRELAHQGLSELRIVGSMHERKALMEELSDAFIALPGGIGTLEELIEMMTWAQLGLHVKRLGLLNVGGYYDPLIAFLDGAVDAGFLSPPHRALLSVASDPTTLLATLLDGAGSS